MELGVTWCYHMEVKYTREKHQPQGLQDVVCSLFTQALFEYNLDVKVRLKNNLGCPFLKLIDHSRLY